MNVEPIEITAADGVLLRGQYWIGGDSWAILFHEAERDLDCWYPIIAPLISHGFSVLTLDMRGHGASDGEWNSASLGGDLDSGIAFARNNGVSSIALICARPT